MSDIFDVLLEEKRKKIKEWKLIGVIQIIYKDGRKEEYSGEKIGLTPWFTEEDVDELRYEITRKIPKKLRRFIRIVTGNIPDRKTRENKWMIYIWDYYETDIPPVRKPIRDIHPTIKQIRFKYKTIATP